MPMREGSPAEEGGDRAPFSARQTAASGIAGGEASGSGVTELFEIAGTVIGCIYGGWGGCAEGGQAGKAIGTSFTQLGTAGTTEKEQMEAISSGVGGVATAAGIEEGEHWKDDETLGVETNDQPTTTALKNQSNWDSYFV